MNRYSLGTLDNDCMMAGVLGSPLLLPRGLTGNLDACAYRIYFGICGLAFGIDGNEYIVSHVVFIYYLFKHDM